MDQSTELCLFILALVISIFLNPRELLAIPIILAGNEKDSSDPSIFGEPEPFAACRVDECSREVMFNSHFCHGHVGYHNNPSEYLATLNGTPDHQPTGEDSETGSEWWNLANE